jgi:hypothetical protein
VGGVHVCVWGQRLRPGEPEGRQELGESVPIFFCHWGQDPGDGLDQVPAPKGAYRQREGGKQWVTESGDGL